MCALRAWIRAGLLCGTGEIIRRSAKSCCIPNESVASTGTHGEDDNRCHLVPRSIITLAGKAKHNQEN